MSGWIKLHRTIEHHWIYNNSDYLKAWITILINVNYTPGKVLIKNELFEYNPGESFKSLSSWGKIFGWSKMKVRRFFSMLENDNMIVTKRDQKTTHLTVCNWERYQNECYADDTTDDTQTRHGRRKKERRRKKEW